MVLIREGIKEDCIHIEAMIIEFSKSPDYHGRPDGQHITAQQLEQDGFSKHDDKRLFRVYVAQLDEDCDELIGFVLFFDKYSGWYGKCLWMEYMYVASEHSSQDVGAKLLSRLAEFALDNNYARVYWNCFSWNDAVIHFYQISGAKEAWKDLNIYVLEKQAMLLLANK